MKKQIEFSKMVASGNDFVVVDALGSSKPAISQSRLGQFAKQICDRKFGVGADGLLFLEKSKKAKFKMRIFNPDGSEPDMCGNGARCAALYFTSDQRPACPKRSRGTTSDYRKIKFETRAGPMQAEVKKDTIKLKLTDPKDLWPKIDLSAGTQFYKVHYINTGVPHTVFFVGCVDTVHIKEVGKQIRFHKQFQPEGANCNFAQVLDNKTIKIRTYERGVEDETLACGTGSVASALMSYHLKLTTKSPIQVQVKSGEVLKVYFDCKNNVFSNVWLEGSAKTIHEGQYYI